MITKLTPKTGDDFELILTITDDNDAAQDITGWSVRSQVRDKAGALIEALTIDIPTPASGVVNVRATAAQTALWPVAALLMDVETTDTQGRVTSTETITLHMQQDITRDA